MAAIVVFMQLITSSFKTNSEPGRQTPSTWADAKALRRTATPKKPTPGHPGTIDQETAGFRKAGAALAGRFAVVPDARWKTNTDFRWSQAAA
jgi:hypothetical protein